MQFKVGDFQDSIRMLTDTLKADWIRYLLRGIWPFSTLKQGGLRGRTSHIAAVYLFEMLHAPQKKLISFSVLYLPGKNVLHAPSCNKMAILDHGEVLSQTSLDTVARDCGGSQKKVICTV